MRLSRRISPMSILWLPSGKLSDGTLLYGPLFQHPGEGGYVTEVKIDATTWYVKHSSETINPELIPEFHDWVLARAPRMTGLYANYQRARRMP